MFLLKIQKVQKGQKHNCHSRDLKGWGDVIIRMGIGYRQTWGMRWGMAEVREEDEVLEEGHRH